jgi:hypothetical protein
MWISAHLTGGIGNRLFEFAAALGLAEKWNRQAIFFLPRCGPTNHGPFDTIFKMFPTVPVIETADEWAEIEEKKREFFTYLPFDDQAPSTTPFIVCGWRQSPLYFPKSGVHALLSETLDKKRWASLQATYALETTEQKQQTWFLHVRLGDYKVLPHHQVNLSSYYVKCLERVPPKSKILFFSDEPNLCKESFKTACLSSDIDFQVCDESDELECLALMSQCWGGAITANSTFSWWGAYFAYMRCPSKESYRAFFPGTWGQGLPPAKDVVPFWGIKIDV